MSDLNDLFGIRANCYRPDEILDRRATQQVGWALPTNTYGFSVGWALPTNSYGLPMGWRPSIDACGQRVDDEVYRTCKS